MNTLSKTAALPFNRSAVHFADGWSWSERPYWGRAGLVIGIIPARLAPELNMRYEDRSFEFYFYFAAIAHVLGCAASLNGELDITDELDSFTLKWAEKCLRDAIEKEKPVQLLLSEYDIDDPCRAHKRDISDLNIIEYINPTTANIKNALVQMHGEVHAAFNAHTSLLEGKCHNCQERPVKIQVLEPEYGRIEDYLFLCLQCHLDLFTEKDKGMTFESWYDLAYNESWTDRHQFTPGIQKEYEQYCEENGVSQYYVD